MNLLQIKRLLDSIPDAEIADTDLWIDCQYSVEAIVLEEDSITLLTDKDKLKYNDAIF